MKGLVVALFLAYLGVPFGFSLTALFLIEAVFVFKKHFKPEEKINTQSPEYLSRYQPKTY